jgi:hypothetical protein
MWLRRFTNYILENRWRAIALTFVITFIPLVGMVGILIAALVTLRKGMLEGGLFTVAATLPFVISFYLSGGQAAVVPLALWAAVGVAVLSNLLTWVYAVMLCKKKSWSAILQTAALFGVFLISVIHLCYPGVADWWGKALQSYYSQASNVAGLLQEKSVTSNEAQIAAINITKEFATGLMTAAVLFNAVLQLVIARWWECIVYTPGLLRRELHNIRLSRLAGALFILSLVFAYLGNGVVLDIMPVLYMLFVAAGLSLIHYMFGLMRSKATWFWLALLYTGLILGMQTSVLVVSVLALLDVWVDVRRRFNFRREG